MKSILTAVLFLTSAAFAEPARDQLKLANEMQAAVLQTQNIKKIEQLLARGVDINAPIGCGTFSPLDGAVYKENAEMLKFLLAHGAKPRGRELPAAAFSRGPTEALEMVSALLKAGIDPNIRDDAGGSNSLVGAAYRGRRDVIKLLLSQPGIRLDETDSDGNTALMFAVQQGFAEIVDLLLQAGANPAVTNRRGETAAALAQNEIEKQRAILSKLASASK
jgi:ankyrin repeat protein